MNIEKISETTPNKEEMKGIIDEINQEGWEGNAALHIGTREELNRLREKLYSNGHTANVADYIRLHSKVVLPWNELSSSITGWDLSNWPGKNKGAYWNPNNDQERIKFLDKDGNIRAVHFYIENIASLKGEGVGIYLHKKLRTELKQNGFVDVPENSALAISLEKNIEEYSHRNNSKKTNELRENFDF